MRDLRQQFEALDLLEAPYQWTDIERRAARPEVAQTPSWLHGVWVAATAAAAVLVFVGGVVAGRWVLGPGSVLDAAFGGSGLFRAATPADVNVLALVMAGASGGSVLLATTLTLAWRWRKRNGRATKIEERGELVETMEKTVERPERTIETVIRNNRWLILAVVVLLAALVALGAWLLIDNFVTSDIERVVADQVAAMNAGDVDAFMDLHTEDIVLTTVIDGSVAEYEGAARLRVWFNGLFDSWYTETTGEVVVSGDFVTHPETVGLGGEPRYEGFHIYRFDDGLVAESYFIGRAVPRS